MGEYAPLAHAAIDEILAAGHTPLVVGGTGLYFRAALAELELPPAPPAGRTRDAGRAVYDEDGAEAAHAGSAELDPAAAERVHPNDRRRVVRALELAEAGASLVPRDDRLFGGAWRHPTLVVGLDVPKDPRARIAERTRRMFELGVEDEVRQALEAADVRTARKVIGLDEVATLPREEAIEALIVRTRRYAAYQRKWLRRLEGVVIVAADRPPEETAAEIVELARTREHLSRP